MLPVEAGPQHCFVDAGCRGRWNETRARLGDAIRPRAQVGSEMRTDVSLQAGLTEQEVAERIAADQANASDRHGGRSMAQILRANVLTRFNAILGSLLVVVVFVGPIQDGLFGVVLAVNTLIGVAQELRAKRTLDRLAVLTAPTAHALRDGQPVELPADEVVLDDLLELRPGDQIVVDGLVLAADGLEIDESLVSGEAIPVGKLHEDEVRSGSFVVSGTGLIGPSGSAATPSPSGAG